MASVNGTSEIHSVILNMNSNYSNNTGSSFSQIVNKQIELAPNTLVALYTGNLIRKPIVIEEDMILDIVFESVFPTFEQATVATTLESTEIQSTIPQALSVNIVKGYYSKMTFARYLCDLANSVLSGAGYSDLPTGVTPKNGGNEMVLRVPYRLHFESKDGNVWLGLRYTPVETDTNVGNYTWRASFQDLDDNCNTSNGLTIIEDGSRLIMESSSKASNWNHFALANNPLKPQCFSHLSDTDALPGDIGWASFNYNLDPIGSLPTEQLIEMVYALDSTYFSSRYCNQLYGPPVPPTIRLVDANEKPLVPNVLIGAYIATKYTSNVSPVITSHTATFYINDNLREIGTGDYNTAITDRNRLFDTNLGYTCAEIDLLEYDLKALYNHMAFECYAVDVPSYDGTNPNVDNGDTEASREYYFRWYIKSPYANDGSLTVLYDSKHQGINVPKAVIEAGYLFQALPNVDDGGAHEVSGGLCPQFFFKNCSSDFKVSNPKVNTIVNYQDTVDIFNYNAGISAISFNPTDENSALGVATVRGSKNISSLENILGIAQNRVNSLDEQTLLYPNMYPSNKDMSGITQIGSDMMRYNIEVNLPIKAYNTTEESANDIGQQRTIVYNTNMAVENDNNPTIGLINKNLEPNNIKYLSLNNPESLKLNTLDIKIRRAKTNQIADEITDASVELLFVSEKTK
tara:strand:+ start:2819 stop:4879 length:2061 start_codon:yes stop_codon:yes gene_type:complete